MPASSIPGHVWRRQGTSPKGTREKVGPVGTNCSFTARCQELKDGKSPSTADAFIQVAYEFFEAGREAWRMKGWAQPRWFCLKIKKGGPFFLLALGTRYGQTKFWPWAPLQHKYSQLVQPLQDQASSLCGRAFSQLGAQAMLAAVPCLIYEKSTTKWWALGPTTRKFLVDLGKGWVGLGLAFSRGYVS